MASVNLEMEYLTPTEAAMVADVPIRDVNRLFDEHLLPDALYSKHEGRRLRATAAPFVCFYFRTAESLTSKFRSELIDYVVKGKEYESAFEYLVLIECKTTPSEKLSRSRSWLDAIKHFSAKGSVVTLNLDLFFEETTKRYSALVEARNMVVEDPEILSGTPIIRGTRVPVYDVAASVSKGISFERILAAYPTIDKHTIELAKIYADATPSRGRPKVTIARPDNAVVRRVARRSVK